MRSCDADNCPGDPVEAEACDLGDCQGKFSLHIKALNIAKGTIDPALTALTSNFDLVWWVLFGRFCLVGLVWYVWFGRFGLVG